MNRYVFDASAAYEFLARTPAGRKMEGLVRGGFPITAALMDVEVISVTRRNLRLGLISEARASLLIDSLRSWPINRVGTRELIPLIWSLRNNYSAYDAYYVAVAVSAGAMLLTLDGKLSNAPNLPCPVTVF